MTANKKLTPRLQKEFRQLIVNEIVSNWND